MSGTAGATLTVVEPAAQRLLAPAGPVPVAVPGAPAAPLPLFTTERLWDALAWVLEVRRRPALLLEALRRPSVLAALLAAAACLTVIAVLPPVGADVAAQEFRAWLFRTHGPLLWQNQWYGGHLVLGYSVVYPALAAVVGVRALGVLACVWGAGVAGALLRQRLAAVWFAAAFVGQFVQGQYPFALGVSFGLSALLAARHGRRTPAAVCAGLASLSSPLAGAFVLLLAVAWWTQAGWRRTAPLAAAGIGVGFGWLLGGGGWFPFPGVSLLTVLTFCAGGLWLVRPLPRAVRWGLLTYAAASLVVFSYPNAVGGNIARLGALAGGPLAALVFHRAGRRRVLALVAVPLIAWQAWPSVGAVLNGMGDLSSRASYYTGLKAFLRTQNPAAGRLEVPSLRQHWEAAFVAEAFPVARGWERQLDLRNNSAVYRPELTAEQLHTWLRESGVVLVALPDAPLDRWAKREAELIAAGQPWLVPVWHDEHWRVFRVADPAGMATGQATLSKVGIDTLTLVAARRGDTVVRVRWSPYWRVASGPACIGADPDGWLLVRASQPGKVVISARSPLNPLTGDESSVCAPPPKQPAGVRARATAI